MDAENLLLQYLNGEISFSEWIDKQSDRLEFSEAIRSPARNEGFAPFSANDERSEKSSILHNTECHSKDTITDHQAKLRNQALQESSDDDDNDSYRTDQVLSESTFEHFSVPAIFNNHDSDDVSHGTDDKLFNFVQNLSHTLSNISAASENYTEYFCTSDCKDISNRKWKKLYKCGPSSHKLREDLRQQMGVANLFLARGNIAGAIDVCMEIVRQAPHNPHAFKTLSVIYDEKGDSEKALQFALVSAFIGCRDAIEWNDLARRCIQAGNRNQALLCYSRACKISPKNIVMHWEKSLLLFENKEYRKALDTYHTILKLIPNIDGEKMIELCKQIAMLHHQNDISERAIDILEYGFSKYPESVDSEGLNILAELHLSLKNFERALEVLCRYGGICVQSINDKSFGNSNVMSTPVDAAKILKADDVLDETVNPNLMNEVIAGTSRAAQNMINRGSPVIDSTSDDFKIDLMSFPTCWTEYLLSSQKDLLSVMQSKSKIPEKYILDLDKQTNDPEANISMSQSRCFRCIVPLHLPIDIRVKVAVCLIELRKECNIQHILEPLLEENVEDVGDLYLDIAEAYIDIGRFEQAIPFLMSLVRTEKYSMPAVWLKLAECQQEANDLESSLTSYYQVLDLAPDQISVRLELSNLCRSLGRIEESVTVLSDSRTNVMGEHHQNSAIDALKITRKEDFILWYQKCTIFHAQDEILRLAECGYIFFINYFNSAATARDDGLGKAVVWEMLIKVLQAMVTLRCPAHASEILDKALSFRPYCENKRYRLELDYLGATVFFLLKDYNRAFDMYRWALIRSETRALTKAATWNLFSRIVCNMHDRKHHKYVLRLLFKQPAILPLIITNGHNAFLCGSYKYALGEYIRAFRMKPGDSMLSLCIGVTYLHLACQRFTKYRHTSVLQGMIFILLYYQMRGRSQEACFNVGRAFHQIGLVHLSVVFYKKALDFPLQKHETDPVKPYCQFRNLHREAAYNLALVYRSSGNIDLATHILLNYISV